MCNNLINDSRCSFYQNKVNTARTVVFSAKASRILGSLKYEIRSVFAKHDKLCPYADTLPDKWISLVNHFLKPYSKKFKLNLKSHSFRINYGTELLRNVNTHQAQQIVGHNDIRSTLKYSRNVY